MSSALAIASVTAVLKHLLENGLVDRGVTASIGGDIVVSALPPDRITTGSDERAQLNLFLHQITPNTGLRAHVRSVDGVRSANAALALDLHYLLTAYGAQDYQIEILLGSAIQVLQQVSSLDRATIRTALRALSSSEHGNVLPPERAALAASDLADQVEQMTVTPQFLHIEEVSRLWSALQARYRPSAVYKVSLVFIDFSQPLLPI